MENSNYAPEGMVVTPHHLATQSAISVLREGGTAMEAVVAAAATIAVVYPHMNSIGGDGFWLIVPPEGDPMVIEACGEAGTLATPEFFAGLDKIPFFGPKSANTVAGTVGGWEEALKYAAERGHQGFPLSRLLADAISYAENGYPVTTSQERAGYEYIENCDNKTKEFESIFLPKGTVPKVGKKLYQKALAKTLKLLAKNGLNSYYKGEVGRLLLEDMESIGMPIIASDLANYTALRKTPLRLQYKYGEIFNTPPPTQGLVSLSVLGILDKLNIDGKHDGHFIHMTVEATKQGFELRDKYITDPRCMTVNSQSLLVHQNILEMAEKINPDKASDVGKGRGSGDTIWLGVMDNKGYSVSFIQSIYHCYGSCVVLPKTGILWHNRGSAFTLKNNHILSVRPGKKPFHTLNPAAARLSDGRVLVYGTRGGDGQSQTQAAVLHRYVVQGMPLQSCISAPRWVFGRTTGNVHDQLRLESRFSSETVEYLKERGHKVMTLSQFDDNVGEAGMLVRHPDGMFEGAYDPRSAGSAAGF